MVDWIGPVQDGAVLPIDIPYILVVESDAEVAMLLQQVIKSELHLRTLFAETAKDAVKVTRVLKPLLFLINECLSDGDGIALYDQLHQRPDFETIPALILSTQAHLCQPRASERHVSCLEIPFNRDDLLGVLVSLLSLPDISPYKRRVS
jgi:CheY-like chemotaxis protein